MSIAAYCRTSTTRQKNDGQIAEIKRWLVAHGYDAGQVAWFVDQESGKTLRRTAFDRLQAEIFAGQVRTVILWKLDRLSRCLRDGINVLADWCERGIKVVVLTQQIELDGPVGRMIAALLLGLAEIELEYRRERQTAGIDVARRRGVYSGRQKGSTKATPKRALALQSNGLTTDEIAQALGVSRRSVQRYLRMR